MTLHDWVYLTGGIALAIGLNVLAFKAGGWLVPLVGWIAGAWQERAQRREGVGRTKMQADTMASITEHLAFHGYACEAQPDGWTFAMHPTRPDFFVRVFPLGVRLVALFQVGRRHDARWAQWLWFANRCNEASVLVKFALTEGEDGALLFRASAFGSPTYSRETFGAFLDTWHHDLALMEQAPPPEDADAESSTVGNEDEGEARPPGVTH